MWSSMLEALSKITLSRGARDDDAVDQLHHLGTVALFAAFAALIGMNQYVGDPIHCWVPAQFPGHHTAFAENLCWISQMYSIPMDQEIPYQPEERMKTDISFYRWVVAVLLFQCLLFKFPNMLWKELKGYSGINVQKIVNMSDEVVMTPPENREKKISDISMFIHKWLNSYRVYKYNVVVRVKEKMSGILCFALGKRHGTYLTGLYLFIKLLNLINVLCQFVMLSAFLKFNYWTYGFQVLQHLGGKWVDVDHFPREVLCDFQVRQLQNVQTFTLQCVLSINLFIEKIFAIAWFWLFLLSIASAINFIMWTFDIFFSKRREHFIEKYLVILGDKGSKTERTLFQKFVHHYLRDDGVFLLRSVGNNSSEIIVMDLIKVLWTRFKMENSKETDGNGNAASPHMKESHA
ncbi:innexin unc-9-like [Physella acuta]|uniref:innexin unc-9-like n=1 Tax=Physella acuta TaxID=109671 RepID=UPI0027DE309B|nr:innexin unc-9-like [Physella acuta]XP_059174231.1 innexin unc-9-like [Physella acuta]